MQTNLAALHKVGPGPTPVTLAVVDTDLDGFDTPSFPRSDFDLNAAELFGAPDEDRDGNGYYHDVYGANVYDK